MPYLAALAPPEWTVRHIDEEASPVDVTSNADLVGITFHTPSALHAYDSPRNFASVAFASRREGRMSPWRRMKHGHRRRPQAVLSKRIKEIAETRVGNGYRHIHALLRREGWRVNAKRMSRLCREMGLQLRNQTPKRRVQAKLRNDGSGVSRAISNRKRQQPPAHALRSGRTALMMAPRPDERTADPEIVGGSGPKCKILHTHLSNRICGARPWRA